MSPSTEYRPSRADRAAVVVFMVAGCAIIVWSGVAAAMRILELLRGETVSATAHFLNLQVEAPIGEGGALHPVEIDTAKVTATGLSGPALGAGVLAQGIFFVTIATVVICLLLLARDTLRGRIFGRHSTVLVTTAGLTGLVGFGVAPAIDAAVANDALARISGGDFDGYAVLVASPLPFVLAGFVGAIVINAYSVGARMQRDTEGLV